MPPSRLETQFAQSLIAAGLPTPMREYRFHPDRLWRMDFAWPQRWPPVAVEIEGGIWRRSGRHVRGKGFTEDCVKYSEAAILGWVVLRFTAEHIKSGYAIETLRKALQL